MIREKEKNNKEGQRYRLKKFEEEGYREAVSSIICISQGFFMGNSARFDFPCCACPHPLIVMINK